MAWKNEIKKEVDEDKTALIGITQAKLEQIESALYSLSVEQLEKLYDALDDMLLEFYYGD